MLCSRVTSRQLTRSLARSGSSVAATAFFGGSSSTTSTVAAAACCSAQCWAPRRWMADKKEDDKSELPEGVKEEMEKLQAHVKKLEEEVKEMKNRALYSAAEADNARRIAREDVAKAKDFGIVSFAKDMLEVNDTLERAIEAFGKLAPEEVKFLTEHKLFSQLVTGVKMSHKQMVHNLGRHAIEEIEAEAGTVFDPKWHDAVFNTPATDDAKDGEIAHVTKKGYKIKERVLRATQCGVAQNQ